MSEELYEAYCRDELNSAERQHLFDLIRNDADRRRDFLDHLLFRCAMIKSLRQEQNLAVESKASSPLQVAARRPTASRSRSQSRSRSRSRPRGRGLAVGLLVVLLLGIAAWMLIDSAPGPVDHSPLATASGPGAMLGTTGATLPLEGAHRIQSGDQLIASGSSVITLRYADGSTISLRDGAMRIADWRADKTLQLERGLISASVTPQTTPLRLIGELTETTVLGTTFTLQVGDGWSELRVNSGTVQFTRRADQAVLLVAAQQMARHAPGIPWAVHAAGTPVDCTLDANTATIDAGSAWQLVSDPAARSGFALEDSAYNSEQEAFKQAQLPAPARFSFFAEAGTVYSLWIRGSVLPSAEPAYWTDAVFVVVPRAQWPHGSWQRAEGWGWVSTITRWPPAIFNSFATRYEIGSYGWVAGPADPDDVDVPERLRLSVPTTGIYELELYPISGPLRIDRLVLRHADQPAPDAE